MADDVKDEELTEDVDLDEEVAEEEAQEEEQEDRGDEVTEVDPDDEEEVIVDGVEDDEREPEPDEEPDADEEEEEEEPEDDEQDDSYIPPARMGEVAREKNIAFDLIDGITSGNIDGRLINDMGGHKAVVKMIAKGELSLQQLASGNVPETEGAEEGPAFDLDDAFERLEDARLEGDVEEAVKIQKEIHQHQMELYGKMATDKANKIIEDQAAAAEKGVIEDVAVDIFKRRTDLREGSQEILDFWAFRNVALDQGMSMPDALLYAEQRIYGSNGNERTQQSAREDRKRGAVKRNIAASKSQPPRSTERGIGTKESGALSTKDIEKMSDDDWDKLPAEEKKRLRGD